LTPNWPHTKIQVTHNQKHTLYIRNIPVSLIIEVVSIAFVSVLLEIQEKKIKNKTEVP